jgi:fused signal recognition particle receptor
MEPTDLSPAVDWVVLVVGVVLTAAVGLGLVVWRRSTRRVGSSSPAELPAASGPAAPAAPALPAVEVGVGSLFRAALFRTRDALKSGFDSVFGRSVADDGLFEALEETLLIADVGVPTTQRLIGVVRGAARAGVAPAALRDRLREEMRAVLGPAVPPLAPDGRRPFVVLVVGVNGSGKTTTIGKLAARFVREGHKVLLAAGDTFRAAADIVRHDEGADPGAVVFDALTAAKARGVDVVIIDTAGRLQTKKPLMEQLGKVRRVIDKVVPGAPHETLLVVDGTTGQNAVSQAHAFHAATPLTGVVVTKLDGTAKGGVVLAIGAELGLPVRLVGIGEKVEDLRDFDASAFVDALTLEREGT